MHKRNLYSSGIFDPVAKLLDHEPSFRRQKHQPYFSRQDRGYTNTIYAGRKDLGQHVDVKIWDSTLNPAKHTYSRGYFRNRRQFTNICIGVIIILTVLTLVSAIVGISLYLSTLPGQYL